jgi:hypothetical protein
VKWLPWACCFFLVLLFDDGASAAVQRFAIVVGNNQGYGTDAPLRYAESDAEKMGRVLRELGGYRPENVVLLRGESAGAVEGVLAAVNDRVRAAKAAPGNDAVLFVYYSGHADRRALHLGESRLELSRLAALVRESDANVRLLVVDACRSGALTRVKGGRIVAPFDLGDEVLAKEGIAFMTASSEDEDAQESDELKGSFFTHALVSGMLGAADDDRDGQVVLEEAYAHAYAATLRSTSTTLAGAQHPAFHYDVRGQGSLVLTRLAASSAERGLLTFPGRADFLVMKDSERGEVVGEVPGGRRARTLSLRPGRYFVRGRAPAALLEGNVSIGAGQRLSIDEARLDRVEYARLVRKGAGGRSSSHAVEVGAQFRTVLPNASTPCWGALVGYRLSLEWLTFAPRFAYCKSSFENDTLRARTEELALSITALRVWDRAPSSVYAGLGLGGTLTRQSFETRGEAPVRLSLSPFGSLTVGALRSLGSRGYVGFEGVLESHLLNLQQDSISEPALVAAAALRLSVIMGLQF